MAGVILTRSLARACATPIDDATLCAKARALATLNAKTLSQPAPPTAALPCCHYLSATGLMSKFNFVDKGGDFVLCHLANGRLLGASVVLRSTSVMAGRINVLRPQSIARLN
jgi:hypothetical protein